MKRYSEMSENNRAWSRIYGIVSGLSLAVFGLIAAAIIPVVGIITVITGVTMAGYTANKYKKA